MYRRLGFEALEDRRLLSLATPQIELFKLAPALFVENQGQWADPSIRFVHDGSGANVAMTDSGVIFRVFRSAANGAAAAEQREIPCVPLRDQEPDPVEVLQFSASFVGANHVVPVGRELARTQFNYFIGPQQNWRSAVPAYEKVVYENLYDGIDLWTWGKRSHLKYEFRVAPGVDYRQIQVRYEGIAGLSLAADGSLVVDLGDGWGSLIDDAPVVYQEIGGQRAPVAAQFLLLDQYTYGFDVTGTYDPKRTLVIDPDLLWSVYIGGTSDDVGNAVCVDAAGNILVAGDTYSDGWVSGGFDTTYSSGNLDAFVVKLSPAGTHLWSSYLGGDAWEVALGVAADAQGNVFVAGATESPGWVSGGFDIWYDGRDDAFVVKLSPSGMHLWSTYLGGAEYDKAHAISIDSNGNVLVAGDTYSGDWVSGGFDTSYNGGWDGFAVKLSPSGGMYWSTYLGGASDDGARAIAADATGNVLVAGYTRSSGWVSGGFDTVHGGWCDGFVVKLSPNGLHLWSSYVGGSLDDAVWGIAVDGSGNVLVAGSTCSGGWVLGGFDTTFGAVIDGFVAKLSGSGEHVWSTYLGGTGDDAALGIGVDATGNSLVTGYTYSSGWISGGFCTSYLGGLHDAFVVKLSSVGQHLWSTYIGGKYEDYGTAIGLGDLGNVCITGSTKSFDLLGANNRYHGDWSYYYDAFVAKIAGLADPREYCPVVPVPTVPVGNYTPAYRSAGDIRWIVLHTTENTASSAINWFCNPVSGVSAHYLVARDGTVYRLVRDQDIAHHAGNWAYNQRSIGIELERYGSQALTDAQYLALAQLVRQLCQAYSIPVVLPGGVAPANPAAGSGIIGHNQVPHPSYPNYGGGSNYQADPVNFDWPRLGTLLTGSPVQRPPAPQSVQAKVTAPSEITVTWEAAGSVDGFVIERRVGMAGTWEQMASVGGALRSWVDRFVNLAAPLSYRIASFFSGRSSEYSQPASANPLAALAPRISKVDPSNPKATGSAQLLTVHGTNFSPQANVTLRDPNSNNHLHWQIKERDPAGTWIKIEVNFGTLVGKWRVEVANPSGEKSEMAFTVSPVEQPSIELKTFDWNRFRERFTVLLQTSFGSKTLEQVVGLDETRNYDESGKDFVQGFVQNKTFSNEEGIKKLLWFAENDPALNLRNDQHIRWLAYMLATTRHETARCWHPIQEIGSGNWWHYFEYLAGGMGYGGRLGNAAKGTGEGFRYRGRGYVQITGKNNYSTFSSNPEFKQYLTDFLGRLGQEAPGPLDLVANPNLALTPEIAYAIMSYGMRKGAFRGYRLDQYIPATGSSADYYNARDIVNADKASKGQTLASWAAALERVLLESRSWVSNGCMAGGSLAGWEIGGNGLAHTVSTLDGWAVRLTTASPVRISQTITTPQQAFELSFDYQFLSTAAVLEVMLDSAVLARVDAPSPLPTSPLTYTMTVTDPALLGRESALLEFRFDGASGSQLLLTNIFAGVPVEPGPAPTLELHPDSDSGVIGDGWTADVTPLLRGTTLPGTSVVIYVDSLERPAAKAAVSSDTYTVTLGLLAPGQHTIWAQAVDSSGNWSLLSVPLVLGIEPCPPLVEGTSSNDSIRLARDLGDPSRVDVFVNTSGPAPTKTVGLGDIWQWIIRSGEGDDRLELDFSQGDILPQGGLVFDAGPEAGGNSMVITGTSGNDTVTLTGNQVLIAGRPPIDYSNVEWFTFELGAGSDALVIDGAKAKVTAIDVPSVTVQSGQLTVPWIGAQTVSIGPDGKLSFASSRAGAGTASGGAASEAKVAEPFVSITTTERIEDEQVEQPKAAPDVAQAAIGPAQVPLDTTILVESLEAPAADLPLTPSPVALPAETLLGEALVEPTRPMPQVLGLVDPAPPMPVTVLTEVPSSGRLTDPSVHQARGGTDFSEQRAASVPAGQPVSPAAAIEDSLADVPVLFAALELDAEEQLVQTSWDALWPASGGATRQEAAHQLAIEHLAAEADVGLRWSALWAWLDSATRPIGGRKRTVLPGEVLPAPVSPTVEPATGL